MSESGLTLEQKADQAAVAYELLAEAFADVKAALAADEHGWTVTSAFRDGFDQRTRTQKAGEAELAAVINPLIKRGLSLRAAYVWGLGVTVTVRDEASTGQDIQAVVTRFWDDPDNRAITTMHGQLELERALGTAGENWIALPTSQQGRVRVRPVAATEITEIITDPEDALTDWLYLRVTTDRKGAEVKRLYPALGWRPAIRPATATGSWPDPTIPDLTGVPVMWDQPMIKVIVNRYKDRGTGDALAALPWAYAYKEFLESWHKLMRSLARFAWQVKTSRAEKAVDAAQKILAANQERVTGATAVMDAGSRLEAIGKSGASFDSESGRPIATMVAAAFGLPVTTLLSDPGQTGARAVAETLSVPTELEFGTRRTLWASVFQDIIGWVIDSAVRAGTLTGTVERDEDRETVTLPAEDTRTVVVDWPGYDTTDVKTAVDSILTAQASGTIPPLTIARLLLKALDVPDMDDVLDLITDDQGDFVPLDVLDGQVRDRIARRGGTDATD